MKTAEKILRDYNVKMQLIFKKLFDYNTSRLPNHSPLRLQNAIDSKKEFNNTIKELESYVKEVAESAWDEQAQEYLRIIGDKEVKWVSFDVWYDEWITDKQQ